MTTDDLSQINYLGLNPIIRESRMFVGKSMTGKVITIDPETGILKGQNLMTQHRIRHLPVIDVDSEVIDIITDHDIRSALLTKWDFDQLPPYNN